jgi:hypothetical protein
VEVGVFVGESSESCGLVYDFGFGTFVDLHVGSG